MEECLDRRGNIKVNQYFQVTTEDPQLIIAKDRSYLKDEREGLGALVIDKVNE